MQADYGRYKEGTSARIDELSARVTHEVDACRDKLERELSAIQGDVVAKCKALESMCQVCTLLCGVCSWFARRMYQLVLSEW